jgi:CDP-diacylglycerol--glycerol-3-phosphate 3-phosphatidyltransferase
VEEPFDGEEAVREIRLCGRARTHAGSSGCEEVELLAVRMRCMDDRRARREAAARVEKLDRTQAVLGETLLDLTRLFVGVDVERQRVLRGVAAELLEPVARARADGVRGDADAHSGRTQLLQLGQVRRDRRLAKAIDPAARVRDVEEDDVDPRLASSLDRCESLGEPEVVELPDRDVTRVAELAIDVRIRRAHALRRLPRREREHRLAPRPEIRSGGPLIERTLKRMAMGVDKTGLKHARILPHMEAPRSSGRASAASPAKLPARSVSTPLAQLPNALTIARLLLIPVFVALMIDAGYAPSWPAGIVFGIAGITDQVDGFLARRWHVESHFGKIADPLADRLMIDAAVILLAYYDRLPWIGLAVIVGRDLMLLAGARVLQPRGIELDVNIVGKTATWILYAAIGFRIVTQPSTQWPLYLFWAGLALAVLAAVFYVRDAREQLRR